MLTLMNFRSTDFLHTEECGQIQFGSRNGSADVVLGDGNGGFAAIAECKGAGYEGHGIEQLKSYLSATDTRFGIFANRQTTVNGNFMRIGEETNLLLFCAVNLKMGLLKA